MQITSLFKPIAIPPTGKDLEHPAGIADRNSSPCLSLNTCAPSHLHEMVIWQFINRAVRLMPVCSMAACLLPASVWHPPSI